jgi:hypothetical protein
MTDKKKTISTRWRDWARLEPGWAYSALSLMALSFVGLIVHLWVLSGLWRGLGLIVMIVAAVLCELILILRRQIAWATYWGICVIGGVSLWEILSYFTKIFPS